MNLFAKLEYVNPVGSIKDRPAYWILRRAAERGEICEETTVIESSSGNFAVALAAFTHLVGLRFIPVIDPLISGTYESFLRRICPTVVKVEDRDDTGGFLKTRQRKVKELCATIPNAYWTNQYGNLDAMEAHYELTATEICAGFDSLDYVFIGVGTGADGDLRIHVALATATRSARTSRPPGYSGCVSMQSMTGRAGRPSTATPCVLAHRALGLTGVISMLPQRISLQPSAGRSSTLRPASGYAGALAIEGTGWCLRQWQWKTPQRGE
jgi:hypothetical protein